MRHIIALVCALMLNAAANLAMKVGMKTVSNAGSMLDGGVVGGIKTVLTSPVLLGGLICFGLNVFLYMYALQSKVLKISVAYPIMVGGGYAVIAVAAYFLPSLRERLSVGQWLGVTLILIGVITVAVLTPNEAAS